ncbi:MAG TPA: hypothetical protein VEW66_04720, partial [Thermomicrobiales bacterium]|nr:hypothetical protein [Thermomicrobiales bacterium]
MDAIVAMKAACLKAAGVAWWASAIPRPDTADATIEINGTIETKILRRSWSVVLAAMARVLSTDEVTYSLLALAMAIALTSATDVDASSNSAPDLMRVGHDCVFLQGTLDSLQLGSPISD